MTTGHALALPPEPAVVEPTVSTVASHTGELGDGSRDEESFNRQRLLGTVASLLQRSMSPPQQQPISSPSRSVSEVLATRSDALLTAQSVSDCLTSASTLILDHIHPATPRPVKETKYVSLEYDPASKRKVLNTYEILREIGRGEHGKVKLAKNLVNNELVAIKIVSRRSKDRSLRMRRHSTQAPSQRYINEYEAKIKREIAIMKRCDHKHIVRFKEVLDDRHSYKIYLVLEYMDRGEIKWKRQSPITSPRPLESLNSEKIPCWAGTRRMSLGVSSSAVATEDNDLLSREFSPNLTFRQSRRIFRDVLLGLEYLHMQGIVHRDIKPANLLVSADYTVKISDFGVSFASSLGSTDDGIYFSDMELAKTVGTPAFFAPELCQTSITDPLESQDSPESLDSSDSSRAEALDYPSLPKVDHKIDIWAMGVTLYCLLFGRVPFNADSEFALFDVIVNEELEFPTCRSSFFSPQEVSEKEFELAKDLLRKMLDKNSRTRIDIAEIKCHDFVLMDLEDDPERLHEFYFLNAGYAELLSTVDGLDNKYRSENNSPAVGIAKRVSGSLLRAFSNESGSSIDSGHVSTANNELQGISEINKALEKISCLQSRTKSSEESGSITSPKNNHQKSPSNTSAGIASSQWLPKVSQDSSHSSTSMLNPSTQHTRRGSIVHANSLLQDVRDYGAGIRRDSSGSQEAPQIETKRNVGGDLYMKNQSAIEAFKDIQKSDKKRRKSNLFTTLSRSSSTNGAKQSKAAITSPTQASIAEPVPICTGTETSSKIKVGPISIDSNRRASSVISLPLTESFASLDSFNDAYLSNKYQEFKKRKHAMRLLDDTITQSDSALMKAPDVSQGITEKFRAFNLSHSMSKEGQNTGSDSRVDSDAVAPRQGKKPFASLHESPESSSYSSSCSSSSSSENEEEGNLTLKFTSKVAPRSRPPFLSLSNRAFSHDSNLTDLVNSPKSNYYTPFSFQNSLDDLEDVPESLMGAESTEQHSQITANAPISKEVFSLRKDLFKSKAVQNNPAQSSPLRSEVVGSSDSSKPEPVMQVALDEHLSSKAAEDRSINIDGGYFNNHYKKEQVRYPLPFSKHLDSDKQSQAKQQSEGLLGLDVRPNYNRSNSITLGLLQHEPLDFE